jgi:hypothetical protein
MFLMLTCMLDVFVNNWSSFYPSTLKNQNTGDAHCVLVGWFMVLNATFNTISVISGRSVSLVEENGVPREYHRPITSHWQTLSPWVE